METIRPMEPERSQAPRILRMRTIRLPERARFPVRQAQRMVREELDRELPLELRSRIPLPWGLLRAVIRFLQPRVASRPWELGLVRRDDPVLTCSTSPPCIPRRTKRIRNKNPTSEMADPSAVNCQSLGAAVTQTVAPFHFVAC